MIKKCALEVIVTYASTLLKDPTSKIAETLGETLATELIIYMGNNMIKK